MSVRSSPVAHALGRFIYPEAQRLSVPFSDDAFIDALVRMCLGFLSPARTKPTR